MPDHDQIVRQFTRRLAGRLILARAIAAVTLWLFLWGTGVLVLRVSQGTSAMILAWGAAGLPVVVAAAVWSALRQLPDAAAVRAFLDQHCDCGGMLMAETERDLGRWQGRMTAVEPPGLRWRGRRPLGLLAVAATYLTLGFMIPAEAIAVAAPLDVNRESDRLTKQVRVLKQEKVIDPERAETLQKKLDEVRSQAAAREPAKTLEALDHLKDVVRQAARQSAESSAREATELGQVEAAAEAIEQAAPKLDEKATTALMAELAKLAQKAAADGEQFNQELDPDLAAAIKDGKLSAKDLSKLAAAAQAGKSSIKRSAQKLYDSRLIDADQLKACEGGQCDGKGLGEFLAKNGGKAGLKQGLDQMGRLPGRGGVTEGPGAAELQYGDRSSADGAKFREEVLPPADLAALKKSMTSGISKTAPKRDTTAGPPTSGALAGAAAGGGSANAAPILPKHKATVERYFDRGKK